MKFLDIIKDPYLPHTLSTYRGLCRIEATGCSGEVCVDLVSGACTHAGNKAVKVPGVVMALLTSKVMVIVIGVFMLLAIATTPSSLKSYAVPVRF